jgi:hypothetical protein
MNLMLTNVSPAVSWRVALTVEWMKHWMGAPSSLICCDPGQRSMHVTDELTLLVAVGIDGEWAQYPLGLRGGERPSSVIVSYRFHRMTSVDRRGIEVRSGIEGRGRQPSGYTV